MEKLNIQNIIETFAEQNGISKRAAESMARTFFDVLVEGLNDDGVVRVDGLGTFKVVNVAERESVNVNNGERIVIEGYKKITFASADATGTSASEGRKKPARSTSKKKEAKVELEQPYISDEDLQQNEFSSIDNIISTPESIAEIRRLYGQAEAHAAKTLEAANAALAEKMRYEKMLEEMEAVEIPAEPQQPESREENEECATEQPEVVAPKAKVASRRSYFLWIGVIVLFVAVFCLAYMIFSWFVKESSPKMIPDLSPAPVEAEPAVVPALAETDSIVQLEETVSDAAPDTIATPKTYVMKRGDYLARISREVYGTTDSVSAIIRLNRFPDPDNIPIGSTILLP